MNTLHPFEIDKDSKYPSKHTLKSLIITPYNVKIMVKLYFKVSL